MPAESSGLIREHFGASLRLVAFAESEPHQSLKLDRPLQGATAWQAIFDTQSC